MLINPINGFYNPYTANKLNCGTKRNSNLSFKSNSDDYITQSNSEGRTFNGEYYDYLTVGLAKKFLYVEEPYDFIYHELKKKYDYYGSISNKTDEVLKAIEYLKKEKEAKKQRVSKLKQEKDKLEESLELHSELTKRYLIKKEEAEGMDFHEKVELANLAAQNNRLLKVLTEINTRYLSLFSMEEKHFPNGIMIIGMDNPAEQQEVIKHLTTDKSKPYYLDFATTSIASATSALSSIAKQAKNSDTHQTLFIDNFDKYTVPTEENMRFISKLKGYIINCRNNNLTLLAFVSNPERLDENIIGGHRFEEKIDVSDIKDFQKYKFNPIENGYSFTCETNNDSVISANLYLGSFGADKSVLWIDSADANTIRTVTDCIDDIKNLDMFKDVRYIQFDEPDDVHKLKKGYYHRRLPNIYKYVIEYSLYPYKD